MSNPNNTKVKNHMVKIQHLLRIFSTCLSLLESKLINILLTNKSFLEVQFEWRRGNLPDFFNLLWP